jgi:hypothetical protein
MIIDLHGLKHKEAIELVEDILLSNSLYQPNVDIKVITGNSPRLQTKVIEICKQWGFSYFVTSQNLGEIRIQYIRL